MYYLKTIPFKKRKKALSVRRLRLTFREKKRKRKKSTVVKTMGGKHGMEDGAGLFIYGVSGLLEKVEEGDTENIFAS